MVNRHVVGGTAARARLSLELLRYLRRFLCLLPAPNGTYLPAIFFGLFGLYSSNNCRYMWTGEELGGLQLTRPYHSRETRTLTGRVGTWVCRDSGIRFRTI